MTPRKDPRALWAFRVTEGGRDIYAFSTMDVETTKGQAIEAAKRALRDCPWAVRRGYRLVKYVLEEA